MMNSIYALLLSNNGLSFQDKQKYAQLFFQVPKIINSKTMLCTHGIDNRSEYPNFVIVLPRYNILLTDAINSTFMKKVKYFLFHMVYKMYIQELHTVWWS